MQQTERISRRTRRTPPAASALRELIRLTRSSPMAPADRALLTAAEAGDADGVRAALAAGAGPRPATPTGAPRCCWPPSATM
ncbi:hypothetical protein SGLAM104S_08823 [Streptomyces glaucescens]